MQCCVVYSAMESGNVLRSITALHPPPSPHCKPTPPFSSSSSTFDKNCSTPLSPVATSIRITSPAISHQLNQRASMAMMQLKHRSMRCQLRPEPDSDCSPEDDTVSEEEEEEEVIMDEVEQVVIEEEVIINEEEQVAIEEEEVITGQDEGREPKDYDRRAHIFDKSSRVFQALKDCNGRE